MTLIRVVAAAMVAFLIGHVIGKRVPLDQEAVSIQSSSSDQKTVSERFLKGLRVGFGDLVDHTAPWILLGLGIAAIAGPLLQSAWLETLGGFDVLIFAVLGLPAYVCASGATPLVAIFLINGISPGAAIAFLLTGPATNLTTFGVLSQLHGKKIALIFSVSIIVLAVGIGYLVNILYPSFTPVSLEQLHEEETPLIQLICLVLLIGFYLNSVLRRGARRFVAEIFFLDSRALDLHPHYPHTQ